MGREGGGGEGEEGVYDGVCKSFVFEWKFPKVSFFFFFFFFG